MNDLEPPFDPQLHAAMCSFDAWGRHYTSPDYGIPPEGAEVAEGEK